MVSVIIPVYNSKPYLSKCLDSVLGQSYSDIQVIIVDDGSTDGSGTICDEYAQKDSRVEAYHIPNSGTVISRRNALSKAKGQYVCFVDSDDWIESDMIEQLLPFFVDDNVDFVGFGDWHHYPDGSIQNVSVNDAIEESCENDRKKIITKYILSPQEGDRIMYPLWEKIYKKEFIEWCLAKLPEDIWYGEDLICLFYMLLKCRAFKLTSDCYYHYNVRDNTISHQLGEKRIEIESRLISSIINLFDENKDYFDEKVFWQFIKRKEIYLLETESGKHICFTGSLNSMANACVDSRTTDNIGFYLYDQWIRAVRRGYRIVQFFEDNLYKTVAIYGMGVIGKQLYEELHSSDSVDVIYGIDRNADNKHVDGLRVVTLDQLDKEKSPDAVIVTPVQHYWEIEHQIKECFSDVDVISVEDVVFYSKFN